MRGIAHHSPWLSGHMMLGWMASLGLPMMAGFVAEVAIMIAFWMAFGWWVILPALTLIIIGLIPVIILIRKTVGDEREQY